MTRAWIAKKAARATLVAVLAAGTNGALASIIANGDFETGTLAGWTTFTTANGTIGMPAVVSFDTDGDSVSSNAAQFRVGAIDFVFDVFEGGGIFQNFLSLGRTVTISLDIAASTEAGFENGSGGRFRLFIDGVERDVHDFENIRFGEIERSSLGFVGVLGAGAHELRVEMTRPFVTDFTTPFQYIDDVVITEVMAPATPALLGVGLAALGWGRHKSRPRHERSIAA